VGEPVIFIRRVQVHDRVADAVLEAPVVNEIYIYNMTQVRSGPPKGRRGPGRGTRLPAERLSFNNLTKPLTLCGVKELVDMGEHRHE